MRPRMPPQLQRGCRTCWRRLKCPSCVARLVCLHAMKVLCLISPATLRPTCCSVLLLRVAHCLSCAAFPRKYSVHWRAAAVVMELVMSVGAAAVSAASSALAIASEAAREVEASVEATAVASTAPRRRHARIGSDRRHLTATPRLVAVSAVTWKVDKMLAHAAHAMRMRVQMSGLLVRALIAGTLRQTETVGEMSVVHAAVIAEMRFALLAGPRAALMGRSMVACHSLPALTSLA